jgi:hypothetical protein
MGPHLTPQGILTRIATIVQDERLDIGALLSFQLIPHLRGFLMLLRFAYVDRFVHTSSRRTILSFRQV